MHGGKTVFLARWIFGLRIFGAWIAGMVHMPWRVFFFWNAAGGITWAASVIGLGYFFGHSLHAIEKALGVGGVIAVVTAAIVGLVFWRRFEKQKLHEHDDDEPPPSPLRRLPARQASAVMRARPPSSGSASATMSTASTCAHTRTSSVRSAATRSRALCEAVSAP